MADWTTPADVDDLTGVSVTAKDIKQAQGIVELFADTTTAASDAGNISQRNLRLLARATGYQAAWMTEHPDVFTNMDIDTGSQDGVSATPSHVNAALLAPLAKRCIDRLTWRRADIRVRKRRNPYDLDRGTRDSAVKDDALPWTAM